MSKFWKIGLVTVAAVGIAFATVSTVSAHGDPPFERPTEGPNGRFDGHGPRPGSGPLSEYTDIMRDAVATLLGMSPDELAEARAEGWMLHELAADAGVDMTELRDVMAAARVDMIDAALEDGVLTEEQAQWMLEREGPRGRGPHPGHPHCDGEDPNNQGQGRWNRGS